MITVNAEDWVPTMLLRDEGGGLEQLWITALGGQEWRPVATQHKSGFRDTVVGAVGIHEEERE